LIDYTHGMSASFVAIIEPDEGGYHAYVPSLPGCHTFGDTIDEARRNLLEAVELHIEVLREHGDPVPVEADLTNLI
jgi:predicted RNase H-like HicB family nuclease